MSNLYKQLDESNYDFIKRIVFGKLVYKTIEEDYEELSEPIFGEGNCFNSSEIRKRFYGIKRAIDLIEEDGIIGIDDNNILDELELKKIELEKEKQRFFDQRTEYKKLIRGDARFDELKDIVQRTIKAVEPYKYENRNIEHSDNDLLVGLNDIHFGAVINNYWNKYSPEITRERLEKYIDEIISIRNIHNSENCYITANGDLISGNIHLTTQLSNRENVVQQVMGVSELVSWFISELSPHFKNVYFVVVAGNHSRLSFKDMSPKDERMDDLIPFYIKARLQNITNVHILDDKIDNTIYITNIRGLNYVGIHGDMDATNGILKLVEMLPQKIYAILMGHMHHNQTNYIQGYRTVMSGSLMGVDDYCIEKRILGQPQQNICVCDSKGIKCIYDILFG